MAKSDAIKHVMISGGGRGLGLATVQDLLRRGYAVSTFSQRGSQSWETLREEHEGRFYAAQADVRDSGRMQEFICAAESTLGPLFGLVNNAAVAQDGVLATLPEVEIERMLDVNLAAALKLSRLAIRQMLRHGRGGRIINISSIIAHRGYTGLAVYAATKAGLEGMTRSLARELGPRGITVNSVAPGYMKSDLSAGLSEEQLGQIVRRTPLGRLAEFSDVLPVIALLLSAEGGFISGQSIAVDGGITV